MTDLPKFYVTVTLLGHTAETDINRVTLHLPDGSAFVMFKLNEPRTNEQQARCNALAVVLNRLWDATLSEASRPDVEV